MKNSIIRTSCRIFVLLMIVINGVGTFASTPWIIDPSDYRYDMSLYLDIEFKDGRMDYSLYTVGAFVGDECRGIAETLTVSNGNQCLYLRARSNEDSGEQMTFKYWNMESGEILNIDGVSFDFESNGLMGYPSDPYIVNIVRYYDVNITVDSCGSVDLESGSYEEGAQLVVTAIPEDGFHFTQWSDGVTENPRIISVNGPISLGAEFAPNTYLLTYILDGETYKQSDVLFGVEIIPESEPEREGHTFSGWDNVPATMPAHDVTVSGTFSINSYNAVFKIGEDVIETKVVVFGQPVVAPEAPAKEGHTFAGWHNVPATMPAHDVEILGSYTVNQYKLTYTVDGATYKEYTVDYGTAITAEATPEKEGHTFSGWEGLPEIMPAHDVTVKGSFTVNKYKLTLYLNNEIYSSEEVEFGAVLNFGDPEVPEGNKFDGWITEIPEYMPAHDVEIYGSYSVVNAVSQIELHDNLKVTVCDLHGRIIYHKKYWGNVRDKLSDGIYIINGKKQLIKNHL